jgi:hypothetical protein
LLLSDPLTAPVSTDENDTRARTARRRFDELHVAVPSNFESSPFAAGASGNLRGMTDVWIVLPAGACFTHAGNIIRAEYEIEGGTKSMS